MQRYGAKKSALWRFVTVFGDDLLSETERCIATRQNKMDDLHVHKWHRTQNQSLKQAPLAFYEKFPVRKSCHFGRHFKKRSHQTERCIARTNRYKALPENAFLMQLTPGYHTQGKKKIENSHVFDMHWS